MEDVQRMIVNSTVQERCELQAFVCCLGNKLYTAVCLKLSGEMP